MPTIYRKTVKGQTEIETRAHRLAPRLRGLLILVDGKRDDAALQGLVPAQTGDLLGELQAQGFIEAVEPLLPPPAPTPRTEAAPPAKPASADFETRRRAAVRALNDELGPAADGLSIRIERARAAAELQPLLLQGVQLLANVRGRTAAEAFAARFLA